MGGSWDIPNMACEPGKPKWLSEETSHKSNSSCHKGHVSASPPLSPWVCPCIYPHVLYIFSLLINIWLPSLLPVFVEIPFCKAEGPGPLSLATGLVARVWRFPRRDPGQPLAGNPRPAPSPCRPRPPKIISIGFTDLMLFHITADLRLWCQVELYEMVNI